LEGEGPPGRLVWGKGEGEKEKRKNGKERDKNKERKRRKWEENSPLELEVRSETCGGRFQWDL